MVKKPRKPITFLTPIRRIALGSKIVAIGSEKTIKVTPWEWNDQGDPIIQHQLGVLRPPVRGIRFNHDNSLLYILDSGELTELQLSTGNKKSVGFYGGHVNGLIVSPDDNRSGIFGGSGIRLWTPDGKKHSYEPGVDTSILAARLFGSEFIFCVTKQGNFQVLRMRENQKMTLETNVTLTHFEPKKPAHIGFTQTGTPFGYLTQYHALSPSHKLNICYRFSCDPFNIFECFKESQGVTKCIALKDDGGMLATANGIGVRIRYGNGGYINEFKTNPHVTTLSLNKIHLYYGTASGEVYREFIHKTP